MAMNLASFMTNSQRLVDVAMGRKPADLVIRSGRWVCVQSGEIIPDTDIAISGERIAYVGPDASHTVGEKTQVIQAENRFLLPGLLDGHMHVESGMLTVTEFVRAVIPHGTTSMFIDPHEIANVFGLDGVKLIVDEAAQQPIHVWVQIPSCVPSTSGLETPGADIGPAEVAQAMTWKGVIGLGEMMNFPGVFNGDEKMHAEMAATRAAGKVIGGHYASPNLGLPFHGYVAGGAQDDHEGTRMEDAIARVRQGMKVMLRYGSAWHDVAEGVRAITEMGQDSRFFILCTDDCHCETLVYEGHVNRAVKQAISHGISPMAAIQMCTLNTAEHFGVTNDVGMIAPGRFADILIVKDLMESIPDLVLAKGSIAAKNGRLKLDIPAFPYPEWAFHSIRLPRPLIPADFRQDARYTYTDSHPSASVVANVIGVIENQAPTNHLQFEMPIENGEVKADLTRDIAKVAIVERHHNTGRVQVGLVSGFGLKTACAIGSTVMHDSHQMILIGTDDSDMAIAANGLAQMGGGQIVVKQGEVIGEVRLPIAGLMSNERAEIVAPQAASISEGFRKCGCHLNNPNMQLSLLGLVVIPELRISDLGLVDVNQFTIIPALENVQRPHPDKQGLLPQ
jgi:adenine deaminase